MAERQVKKLLTPKYAALTLFIAYCLDLFWKLAHWKENTVGMSRWALTGTLTVRFAFMAGLLWVYLRVKNRERAASKNQA